MKVWRCYLAIEDNIWGRGWPLHSPTFLVIHLVHVNLKKEVDKLQQQCCEWYSQLHKGTVGQERESTRSSKQPSSMTTCSQGREEGSRFSSPHPWSALSACRTWHKKGFILYFWTCLSLIIEHLRIFVIVSTVILKNGPVDGVAKLVVEVDGDLVAHPEKLYQSIIWKWYRENLTKRSTK